MHKKNAGRASLFDIIIFLDEYLMLLFKEILCS